MLLVCHACNYEIAEIIKDTKTPIKGSMFTSKDVKHGFPAPWSPVVTWVHMYCPMCQKLPFLLPDKNGRITMNTDSGKIMVHEDGFDTLVEKTVVHADNGTVEQPTGAEIELTDTEARADNSESNGEPAGGHDGASEDQPISFQEGLDNGQIKRSGSWYEYDGKSYRKDDLMDMLNG